LKTEVEKLEKRARRAEKRRRKAEKVLANLRAAAGVDVSGGRPDGIYSVHPVPEALASRLSKLTADGIQRGTLAKKV
jgi:hypothetical protein